MFFNDTATTEIYTLALHDALPIFSLHLSQVPRLLDQMLLHSLALDAPSRHPTPHRPLVEAKRRDDGLGRRSEEHTSELQSRQYLVCRLLLEKTTTTPRPLITCFAQ